MKMAETSGVKFVDIPGLYADIEDKIVAAISELIHKGAFVGGPALVEFEEKMARYVGVKFAIGCSDGTSALMLSFLGAGIQKGDGVVVPSNSFIASANGAVHAGGVPVFVDCDPETYLIDLNQTEDVLKAGKARFVMPVHLYGNPCPMPEILALADKYGAKVIEDNAQAIGAKLDGRCTGTFGLTGAVSFYPAKNLGAFGQGGMVLTNDETVAKTVRMYLEQGQGSQRYYHDVIGYNARLHSIQACVLSMMLDKLDGFNAARLRAADCYAARLPADRIQKRTANATPIYHLFEYRCDSSEHRDRVGEALKAADIGFGYHYPVPIHKQKAYPQSNNLSLSVCERLAEQLLSVPMYPGLTEEQVDRVCQVVGSV